MDENVVSPVAEAVLRSKTWPPDVMISAETIRQAEREVFVVAAVETEKWQQAMLAEAKRQTRLLLEIRNEARGG